MQVLSSSRCAFSTASRLLALILAVSYLGMGGLGAACLFGVAPVGVGTHHHHAGPGGKASHSPLCAWACQAGPVASLISFGSASFALFILLWWTVTAHLTFFSQIAWASARPRAPPILAT